MILTRVYIFLTEVQIHIVGTVQFRFAKLNADHSPTWPNLLYSKKVALPRKMTLKTVSILVFNRVFMVITHICSFADVDGQAYSYEGYWYINEQSVVRHKRLAYNNIDQSLLRPADWVGQYQMNMMVRICISRVFRIILENTMMIVFVS